MNDRSTKPAVESGADSLFATAETLGEFNLRAPNPLPDARTACHAADAWARVTGCRAVFVSVGLDETLDALPALATPYGDEIELTAICVLGNDQALDDVHASGRHLSQHSLRLDSPARGRGGASRARKKIVQEFVREHPRGVQLILIPWALPDKEIRELIPMIIQLASEQERPQPVRPPATAVDSTGVVARSARPILVLGRHVIIERDPLALAELARMLNAPVVLTTQASTAPPAALERWNAAWPADVPLVFAASVVWNYALIRADCILTIDARLTEGEMVGLRDFSFVREDRVHVLPVEEVFAPDNHGFRARLSESSQRIVKRRRKWRETIAKKTERLQRLTASAAHTARGAGVPFDPAWVAHSIFAAAPANGVFIGEGNGAGMWMWSYNERRPTLDPDRMSTIGLLLAWAIGASRAAPERPVWCFAGDGSLGYHPALFAELSRRRANVVIFVFNNQAWSSIRLEQTFLFGGRYPGTTLPARNFAHIARDYACEGVRVETETQFQDALQSALRPRRRPLVIDIPMPQDSVPFAGLSFALAELDYLLRPMRARFVASMLRALLTGALAPRIPRMLLRMVLP